jgi:hypoxia up-regulated 1
VTRAELEEACRDLLARLTLPIEKALSMAGMTLSDLQSVELLGGAIRVPSVRKELDEFFKASKLEIGQHLNGDEAMAMGASFRAANLSTSFRVRKVGLTDMTPFGVSIRLETLPSADAPASGFFGLFKKDKVRFICIVCIYLFVTYVSIG